ncbi:MULTISPECIES: hypothetical protein [Halorussus]|uniref:hypothetical protein n=1 Tax=Halorussus TaxID=1070314 RepID=UPI00209CC59D|nr:hypothetical protein [Halorussus vallis]USZ76934.1 hypothetical protein NGM07_06285 [Halorussus vallis]
MRLLADDRGVTVQVGAVLLFAVLIILLSTYQAQVVPQQNERVEFNHNQRVQSQLQELRDELVRAGETGRGGSASVALGIRYPGRAFFVNPPPPSGTLRTTPPANATVENATARGETGDYWDGSDRNFSTRGLVYRPNYHVYGNPPTTGYGASVLYNRFAETTRPISGQRLVDGNRITLVALNGSLSESSSATVSVDPRAVSAATRSVTVRNASADQNVSLVVPTELDAAAWRDLLADQMSEGDGDDRHVLAVKPGAREGTVRVVLEPATYVLRLAKVGVGSDVSGVDAHYVTDVRGDDDSAPEDSPHELVVEVRDRYDNPVAGATVNATLVGDLAGDAISAGGSSGETLTGLETDGEGRVRIRYRAPNFDGENRDVEVRVSSTRVPATGPEFDPGARTNLSFDLTAVNTDGSGLGGGGGSYDVNWTDASGGDLSCDAALTRCTLNTDSGTTVSLTATVTADGDPLSQATVDYAVNDSTMGTVSPDAGVTDEDGRDSTTVDVTPTDGVMTVYAGSGGDADPLRIRVESGDGGSTDIVYNDDGTATRGNRDGGKMSGLRFSVTNRYAEPVTVTGVRIRPTDASIDELSDPSYWFGRYRSELYVESATDGRADIADGTSLPTTIDIADDAQFGGGEPTIDGNGGVATFYLYEFFADGRRVNMNDERVAITLYFRNHNSVTFTVRGNDG